MSSPPVYREHLRRHACSRAKWNGFFYNATQRHLICTCVSRNAAIPKSLSSIMGFAVRLVTAASRDPVSYFPVTPSTMRRRCIACLFACRRPAYGALLLPPPSCSASRHLELSVCAASSGYACRPPEHPHVISCNQARPPACLRRIFPPDPALLCLSCAVSKPRGGRGESLA